MIDWAAILPPAPAPAAKPEAAKQIESRPVADPGASIAAREREGDNRRRCTECGNLTDRGLCLAAQRGEIVASRSYTPVRDLLRRCEGFNPLPSDPDQTPGRVKWGWLATIGQPVRSQPQNANTKGME